MRCKDLGDQNCGRAVSAADDTDGGCFFRRKVEQQRADKSDKDTQLCSSAQQEGFGVRNQRTKVGHRTDAQEDQRRIKPQLNAQIQDVQQSAIVQHRTIVDTVADIELHVEQTIVGDVGQHHTKCDGQQQQRLIPSGNRQVGQKAGNADHNQLLPVDIGKAG